jgi:hypothetical protein
LNFDSSDEEEKEEEGNNDVMTTAPTAGHSAGTNGVPIDRVPEGLIDLPADAPVDRPADGPAEQFADGPPPNGPVGQPDKESDPSAIGHATERAAGPIDVATGTPADGGTEGSAVDTSNAPASVFASNRRPDPTVRWKGLASTRDLKTRDFVLDCHATGRVKCTFELGKLDIIHHTKLEKVAHKLGSRNHEVDKRVGSVFMPRNESHVTHDHGVIRCDEPVVAKHRHLAPEGNEL